MGKSGQVSTGKGGEFDGRGSAGMTAREYLSQAYYLDQRINSKIEQVESLNDLARKAGCAISGMPRNRTGRCPPWPMPWKGSLTCRRRSMRTLTDGGTENGNHESDQAGG